MDSGNRRRGEGEYLTSSSVGQEKGLVAVSFDLPIVDLKHGKPCFIG